MAYLTDKKLKEFDEGLLTGIILIDLQKAFDTTNHKVLLEKLKAIRFSEQSIQLLRSYLCDQIALVETENKLSDFGKISSRVPQSSILWPLLFLICVNDIPRQQNQICSCRLMTHVLCTKIKRLQKMKKILRKKFENVFDWFVDNKLTIRFWDEETKSILFPSKQRAKNILN